MSSLTAITRKELKAYFGSPMAAIFIGAFLLASLFSFFWVEIFFARNIADVRPLFRWMPILLIFLVAALTMRQWSEEQRMGTLETLLTMPVRISHLVVGKFLAVLAMVGVALLFTVGLPVTVAILGNLDWGPVIAGYLGTLLVASAYISMGLFVSSKTDNQIISLITTAIIAGLIYIIGSPDVTGVFGNRASELLRSLGTGSRFESITRGVIDLRDVVYYLSITVFFLVLNTMVVDSNRWSSGESSSGYRRAAILTIVLAGINLLVLNLWMAPAHGYRIDITGKQEYSISRTTKDIVTSLRDPLLMRGYFSEKTHPLLSPLVPRIRDLMKEYAIASGGRIKVEFVDPREDEELEAEANRAYGIRPVPFQIAGRYEASVVNSYFDILIKYGDQHLTLGFNDLIEVRPAGDGSLDVSLRNLEYDLTRSIKKVLFGFQSVESIFAGVEEPIELKAFITEGALPPGLEELPRTLEQAAGEIAGESGGKFRFSMIDPDAPGSPYDREKLAELYGLRPMSAFPFLDKSFYMHLILEVGDDLERIFPSADMSQAEIREEIEAALKRGASGFLKTVGLWTPRPEAPSPQFRMRPVNASFELLTEQLKESYNVKNVDLTGGRVPGDVDVLLLAAPQGMQEREVYAVDQFLMRGGAVVALAGRYMLDTATIQSGGGLSLKPAGAGLVDLLDSYGIKVEDSLVMDERNEPFPIPVIRQVGMFQVREIQKVNYPFFIDVRNDSMAGDDPVTANLPAVTINWPSPLVLDEDKNSGRTVSVLLRSSPDSWVEGSGISVQPDFKQYPERGFPAPESEKLAESVLAVSVRGAFESYFKDRPVPGPYEEPGSDEGSSAEGTGEEISATIPSSPESSRLVVVGSGEFVNDIVLNLSRSGGQDRFLNSLQFLQNAVDWSVEDEDLLGIRSRGAQARLLEPTSRRMQATLEGVNYGVALLALTGVSIFAALKRRREKPMQLFQPGSAGTGGRS